VGRSRPRGRPAPDSDNAGSGPRSDRPRNAGGREQQIVDALEKLRRQLLAVPLGPSEGFRGNLRERLTTPAQLPRP
jgi:hypothetical protein